MALGDAAEQSMSVRSSVLRKHTLMVRKTATRVSVGGARFSGAMGKLNFAALTSN